jgi:hypothetical protein
VHEAPPSGRLAPSLRVRGHQKHCWCTNGSSQPPKEVLRASLAAGFQPVAGIGADSVCSPRFGLLAPIWSARPDSICSRRFVWLAPIRLARADSFGSRRFGLFAPIRFARPTRFARPDSVFAPTRFARPDRPAHPDSFLAPTRFAHLRPCREARGRGVVRGGSPVLAKARRAAAPRSKTNHRPAAPTSVVALRHSRWATTARYSVFSYTRYVLYFFAPIRSMPRLICSLSSSVQDSSPPT